MYVLAVDTDVAFDPESLLVLYEVVKGDDNCAAASGRINPKGSGNIKMKTP